MKSNWKKVKLSDICDVRDGTHDSPKRTAEGRFLITSKHIKGGKIDLSSAYKISLKDFDMVNQRSKVDQWDILLSMIGTIGEVCIVKEEPDFAIKNVGLIKTNDEILSLYLYYYLKTHTAQSDILARLKGTTQQYLSLGEIRSFPISIPQDDRVMRKITKILSSIDDKIELNNKINRNLEAQAQAIFKSWFIDFEPFKNGKFIDSELGKIPEGWKVYRLSELCEIITKGTTPTTLKRSFKNKGINFIKAENISNNHLIDKTKLAFIDIQTHELLSRSQLKPFDILFTIAGTIGRFAIVLPDIIPANTNQAIAIIRCKDIYTLLVYSMFLCGNHLTYFNSKVVQAVQANLSLSTIGSLPMLLPPKAVVERYISIVYPLFKLTFDNSDESSHLAQLRNTLLPKLMTGKVNISDILV